MFFRAAIVCLLLLRAVTAFSQKADTTGFVGFKNVKFASKQNLIKASPLPFLIGQIPICGELRITYERMVTHNQSFIAGMSYNYPNPILFFGSLLTAGTGNQSFAGYSLRGVRGMLGYRYYPFKFMEAPSGLFLGPYLTWNYVRIKQRGGNADYLELNYPSASFIVGYQEELAENFFFEGFVGLGYRNNFVVQFDSRTNRLSREPLYVFRALRFIKFPIQVNFSYAF